MADSVLQGGSGPAYVESGIILDVDVENYTVAAATQFTRRPLYGINFATPYQHHANGEGMYFMPEVGSTCWICFPSDGQMAFVLAWGPPLDSGGGYSGSRKELNPGDIFLGTRDENFLILRRGGIVQIGGGPLNQRLYLPIDNTIKDLCENYELRTLSGDLVWSLDKSRTIEGRETATPSLLTLAAREAAEDLHPIAFLEIGSHPGDKDTILSLIINSSGNGEGREKEEIPTVSLKFTKEGKSEWRFRGRAFWTFLDSLDIVAASTIELSAGDAINISGGTVTIKANDSEFGAMTLHSKLVTNITSDGPVNVGPSVRLGGASTPGAAQHDVMLATPSWLTFLLTHTHVAFGAETSGPGLKGTMGTAYTGTDHKSKTTKSR